jgi:hypothetical protein
MLRGLQKKFASGSKKPAPAKEAEPAPVQQVTSKNAVNSSTAGVSKPAAGPGSKGSGSNASQKEPLPLLNDQTLQQYYAESLPSFRDVAPAEKQLLFVQKLHLCSFTFDFADATSHQREKEIKRQTLLELVDYVNSGQGKFTEAVSEDIVYMISQNLFRTLPPSRSHDVDNYDPEEEEPTLEPAWPHLQVRRRGGGAGARAQPAAPGAGGRAARAARMHPHPPAQRRQGGQQRASSHPRAASMPAVAPAAGRGLLGRRGGRQHPRAPPPHAAAAAAVKARAAPRRTAHPVPPRGRRHPRSRHPAPSWPRR